MSVLNCFVTPRHILISADTRGGRAGESVEVSKILVLPHMPALIAGRGRIDYQGTIAWYAHTRCLPDFDSLADHIEQAMDEAERILLQQGVPLSPDEAQLVVISGWSARAGRLVLLKCERKAPGAPLQITPASSSCVGPWDEPAMGPPPHVSNTQDMIDLARRQVEHYAGEPGFGGRLLVAEIQAPPGRRPLVVIRDLGELD